MVFSSIPAYLDSSNWHQQQNHQIIGNNTTNSLFPPPPPSQSTPPPPQPHGVGSIRPGSMSERARMANIPMPETAQKCPRCESTNTKFCYFNNYSLTQPRHFCKTCRRYWTRGGALRSVPVGGGCRRNKRSKSSTASKSPASSDRQTATSSSTSTISAANNMLNLTPSQIPSLRFMSPLGQITDGFNVNGDVGLNYSGISSATAVGTNEMNFHNGLFSNGVMEPWRLQQVQNFPFLSGLDQTASSGMYQFQGGDIGFLGGENGNLQNRPKFSSSLLTQMASVKMEENNAVNFSRQLLGNMQGNNDQWNTNTSWNEHISSFSTSSASNNQCRNLELSMENGAFSPRDYGEKN